MDCSTLFKADIAYLAMLDSDGETIEFPYGYGKEIYFWSFVVSILIFAVGAGVSLYEGIHHILNPREISDPMINYIVIGAAVIFESVALFMALKEFNSRKGRRGYLEAVKKGKDSSLIVVLFEDSAAMLGLIVAFFGVFLSQLTGWPYFDGIASVVIGLILGGTAAWLAYETKGLLIGEAANPEVISEIEGLVKAYPEVLNVNEVLTMHMGPSDVLCTLSVDFADAASSADVEASISRLELAIKDEFPEVQRVFIEAQSVADHARAKAAGA